MISLPTLLALLPFVIFLLLLLWKRVPLVYVSAITLVLVLVSALVFWRVFPEYVVASFVKGFLVALDIFFIIFGAIFFLEIMKLSKIIENIVIYLESISRDVRVQVILLAWFFENFLEGTAGFGTPSTVVAPLLVGLGINPVSAVILSLLGNSSSVVFGAAGTPIRVGFGGLASPALPFLAARINLIGIIVPVFMLWFLTMMRENGSRLFREALPFALWSGIAFSVTSYLTVALGQEFPSILGAVIGLGIVLATTKLKMFIPKNVEVRSTANFVAKKLPILKVIFPYVLLILFLIVGKFVLGSAGILVPLRIAHTFSYFNPGFAFALAGIVTLIVFKLGRKVGLDSARLALRRSIEPFLVIALMSTIVQIMVTSVHNYSSLPSMIDFMAVNVRNILLPLWAPGVGALGSFLTGSATVSNLMFGNFLAVTARDLGFSVDKILALALVGGAAGNMIALADIMAAEAVVGIKNEENKILKAVIIPCLIYVVLVGVAGLISTLS